MNSPGLSTSARREWRPTLVAGLLLAYFVIFGISIGIKGVLWAEIVAALALSAGVFGTAQLAAPIAAIMILLLNGQLSARFGNKRLMIGGLALGGGTLLLLAAASSLWGLVAALLLLGSGAALQDAAMNSAAVDWERASGRTIMNLLHASFSAGAVAGAFTAGVLLGLGWEYQQILWLLCAVSLAVAGLTIPVGYPPVETRSGATGLAIRLLFERRVLLILALVCLLAIVVETVVNVWSVIYLRSIGAPAFIGGASFALFNSTMLVGRLANAGLVARLGERRSLGLSGAAIAGAALLLLLPGGVPLAVGAFALMGLAVAGLFPTVMSAAARFAPENSGAVVGAIMAVAYLGFLGGPPVVGWLAELVGLQLAFLLVGAGGLGVFWLARHVK